MKLFAYAKPLDWEIACGGLRLVISPFADGIQAGWDDVDPEQADYFIVPFTFKVRVPFGDGTRTPNGSDIMRPGILKSVAPNLAAQRELRDRLLHYFVGAFPFYERFPERHVFLDNGDLDRPCELLEDSILFKSHSVYRDRHVLPLPFVVRDPGPPMSILDADLDASFVGHIPQHPIRTRVRVWSQMYTNLRVEFIGTETSFHRAGRDQRPTMARKAFELMLRSKFVLTPRGIGPTSRRFYEILAHGRIPIHIGDSARFPLESIIEYARFVVRVPEGFVRRIDNYVRDFSSQNDLAEASDMARQTYLEYFAPTSFRRFVELSLAIREAGAVGGAS
jgi:hypothetical protein